MITVLTGVFKREEVFKLFCKNFYGLHPRPRVVVSGLPNDQCEKICRDYGFTYIYSINKPLGKKINDVTEFAAQKPTGYYLYMGMDDLMSQEMWSFYNSFDGERLALRDYYFYNVFTGAAIRWNGYTGGRSDQSIGAGDLISFNALEKCNFRPLEDSSARWSENQTYKTMKKLGVKTEILRQSETGGLSLDLKTGDNVNQWKVWNNSTVVSYAQMIALGSDLDEIIKSYKK